VLRGVLHDAQGNPVLRGDSRGLHLVGEVLTQVSGTKPLRRVVPLVDREVDPEEVMKEFVA
jgi:hypothetical protein